MKRLGEILFAVGFIALLVAPVFIFNVPRIWAWMWVTVVAVVVAFEVISMLLTKRDTGKARTISQQFWAWALRNKGKAIAVLVCWTAAWALLVWHLSAKF